MSGFHAKGYIRDSLMFMNELSVPYLIIMMKTPAMKLITNSPASTPTIFAINVSRDNDLGQGYSC